MFQCPGIDSNLSLSDWKSDELPTQGFPQEFNRHVTFNKSTSFQLVVEFTIIPCNIICFVKIQRFSNNFDDTLYISTYIICKSTKFYVFRSQYFKNEGVLQLQFLLEGMLHATDF